MKTIGYDVSIPNTKSPMTSKARGQGFCVVVNPTANSKDARNTITSLDMFMALIFTLICLVLFNQYLVYHVCIAADIYNSSVVVTCHTN